MQEVDWERPDRDALRAERFDTIICLNVIEHLERDDDALAQAAAVTP